MAHGVTPESLAAGIAAADGPRAVFIVSPTYYGMAADVAGCAEVCHDARRAARRRPGLGAALRLPPGLPPSALSLGADAVLTSTHKIVGSLTQSAMLHVAPTGRIDRRPGRAHGPARALDVAVGAADGVARRRAAPARHPRRGAARPDDGRRRRARAAIDECPACA